MLTTLDRAKDTSTPEHGSIIEFLQARLAEVERTRRAKALHPPFSRNPHPYSALNQHTEPLLVRTTPAATDSDPDPTPMYETPSRPRPREALPPGGKRRIPKLDLAGSRIMFARLGRPQPPLLSRVLTQKIRKSVRIQAKLNVWYEDTVDDAAEEDRWEVLVANLLDKEILQHPSEPQAAVPSENSPMSEEELRAARRWWGMYQDAAATVEDDTANQRPPPTYTHGTWEYGINVLNKTLIAERTDAVARADALRRLVAAETALAAKERQEDHLARRARWEARMLKEHGPGWEDVVAEEKRQRDLRREAWLAKPAAERGAERARLRAERAAKK